MLHLWRLICAELAGSLQVRIWDTALEGSSTRNATLYCKGSIPALEWEARTSKLLLLGTAQGGVRAWNADSKRVLCDALGDGSSRIRAIRASPADATFAMSTSAPYGQVTSSGSSQIAIWALRTFQPAQTVSLGSGCCVNGLAFNHNGKMLAAASRDGFVRLYDANDLAEIMAWQAHPSSSAHSVQFGPDQTSVFSAGSDGRLVEWSLHSLRTVVRSVSVAVRG